MTVFEKNEVRQGRERLVELILNAPVTDVVYGDVKLEKPTRTAQTVADNLLANGVIVPPCNVGDTAWFLLEDDFPVHKWFLSGEKITEVASKGFFTSSYLEPCGDEDFGNYTAYSQIGIEVFLCEEEAKQALRKRMTEKSNMEPLKEEK